MENREIIEIVNFTLNEIKEKFNLDKEITIEYVFKNEPELWEGGFYASIIESEFFGAFCYNKSQNIFYYYGPHPKYGMARMEPFIIEECQLPNQLVQLLKNVTDIEEPKTIYFNLLP